MLKEVRRMAQSAKSKKDSGQKAVGSKRRTTDNHGAVGKNIRRQRQLTADY